MPPKPYAIESKPRRSPIDVLRRRFDERLAVLQAADAGERLRSIMRGPAKLDGKVKAGASY